MPRALAAIAACLVALAATAAAAHAAKPMQTGFNQYPTTAFSGANASTGFGLVKNAGGSIVKLHLDWGVVAHDRPATEGDESKPDALEYEWAAFDQLVVDTFAGGLKPLVQIDRAPDWASDDASGRVNPDPAALARFATAAATRYSGTFDPTPDDGIVNLLPRVKLWQVWNEPNLHRFLRPQRVGSALVSPAAYRTMVNGFADAVKAVAADNLVLAGGTGPFAQSDNAAPFVFMRGFLCLNSKLKKIPGCGPVRFDIWGHHPYTSGAPTRHAFATGDASLGDMPRMAQFLRAAAAAHTIVSTGGVRFWVDEFGWDTSPPDPKAVPQSLHRRWTPEALMRLWDAGVDTVLLHQLADNQWTGKCGDPFQSGLFFYAPTPAEFQAKQSLAAFRFPFVVVQNGRRVRFWGRTPTSTAGKVTIQRKVRSTWKPVVTLQASGVGIFNARPLKPWRSGWFRAKTGTEISPSFELKQRLPNPFYNPFGSFCGS